MIYLTQLIYIYPGREAILDEFEARAIPLIAHYNGKLEFRIRPDAASVIEAGGEVPYEVHLVSFPSDADFQRFVQDKTRQQFLHLKEQAIRTSLLVKGQLVG
ncbi:DUF1330 domain-containing protein [Flavilitoribacter nigricans]|uniref:DUF1330 domain-containing protein n=1 Tax=Flavilitoribacter nigricans (strain ATCC 23147 / DSM 23189 / NBRC 102662 / NCIMB 1420 / SS-2) TaxID=1122177 RepID=A0A2D0NHF2_FLAN2|nr:DUF1330 domain-containing protein [Flavilitoribacter nigricans]PHN07915.1 DUF1330 domain-containing protein [Flavilitoribacter nigricans DSM 23189 = NBRC 102662]